MHSAVWLRSVRGVPRRMNKDQWRVKSPRLIANARMRVNVTRELKLALIVGFSLVLVVTILVSDYFSKARRVSLATPAGDTQVSMKAAPDWKPDIEFFQQALVDGFRSSRRCLKCSQCKWTIVNTDSRSVIKGL